MRDMGTEGAGYADVGLKQAIEDGVIPGVLDLTLARRSSLSTCCPSANKLLPTARRAEQADRDTHWVDRHVRTQTSPKRDRHVTPAAFQIPYSRTDGPPWRHVSQRGVRELRFSVD
jgi:hypothetical protein